MSVIYSLYRLLYAAVISVDLDVLADFSALDVPAGFSALSALGGLESLTASCAFGILLVLPALGASDT